MSNRSWLYLVFIVFLLATVFGTERAHAQDPKMLYFKAEAFYRDLRADKKRQRYRDQWIRCIEKFEAVYKEAPDGPWAAAGLYMTGKLYGELYRLSGRESDLKESIDIFERVVKRYPSSSYRKRAIESVRGLYRKTEKKAPKKTASAKRAKPRGADEAAKLYRQAKRCYDSLLKDLKRQQYRDQWTECIDKFDAVHRRYPEVEEAAAGLYMSGKLYSELHAHSFNEKDLQAAVDIFRTLTTKFPDSRYAGDAERYAKQLQAPQSGGAAGGKHHDRVAQLIQAQSTGKGASESAALYASAAAGGAAATGGEAMDRLCVISGVRFWSNPSYTRVVVDAAEDTTYSHRLLRQDPSINKPKRLYIDVDNARLGKNIQKIIPIHDDLLMDIRAGQYNKAMVRVVIDIKSFDRYKIFSLKNPFRIVVDVWGEASQETVALDSGASNKLPPGALARQFALGVRKVVIDPGHGGKDYGAPGYLKGVHEKYLALDIAKKLGKKIREKWGFDVIYTRKDDRYLTLEERTAIANTHNADLFISIHTNSHRNRRAYGIETYFLNLATDDDAIRVAATENATSAKNISDLQTILNDLMQNAKISESSRLAQYVQDSLYQRIARHYKLVRNKGVKQAPFYVLLGAQMPAILVETSFISNATECKRLVNDAYQNRLCDGIIEGIEKYIKELNPTAFKHKGSVDARG